MDFRVYDRVKLLSDKFGLAKVQPGAVGCIVEDFEDGNFEVEFWDEKEVPYARIVVTKSDIQLFKRL